MTQVLATSGPTSRGGLVSPAEPTEELPASPVARGLELLSRGATGIYLGLGLVVLGLVLLGYTWIKVAATLEVGRQVPYLVSGGFGGLTSVMCGLLLLTVTARRFDAAERARQSQTLVEAMRALADRVERLEPKGP